MKKLLYTIIILSLVFSAFPAPTPAGAQAAPAPIIEPYAGLPLCLPGVYPSAPANCLALGPSTYLKRMAEKGIALPLRALPARPTDPALAALDTAYARINLDPKEPAQIYNTLQEAMDGGAPAWTMPPGQTRYVSIINSYIDGKKKFVQMRGGGWMRASPIAWHQFRGLEFLAPPANSFGWVKVVEVQTRREPGIYAAFTGKMLYRDQVIQVYQYAEANGQEWAMIGMDEWVETIYLAIVNPAKNAPEGVSGGRWIDVNLWEQTLAVYDNHRLVFATMVATGLDPFFTQPGVFQIYKKKPLETMSGAFEADRSDYYYLEDVPWTMYFDKARALHGAYWINSTFLGYPRSHGCVNIAIPDAHWLYNWAQEGDYVHVWDPSGQTPTDPAYYGDGGA